MSLEVLEWAAMAVDLTAAVVMLIGFVHAVVRYVPTLVQPAVTAIDRVQMIRCSLGSVIVFALELLIISDLLHSIVSHTLEDLYFLAAIVVLRTLIAYFLNKEIQDFAEQRASTETN